MIFERLLMLVVAVLPPQSFKPDVVSPPSTPSVYKVCNKLTPPGEPCATPPRVVSAPNPKYSEEARSARVQGTVVLYLVVASDGTPQDIKVARGLGRGLDKEALEAVRNWRFEPGTVDGKPAAVAINVEVNFHLQGESSSADSKQDYRRLYASAQAAYSNHEFEKCIEIGLHIAEQFPSYRSTWNLVGLAYLELEDPENARRAFLQEAKVDPASFYAYNNLGRALLRERKFPEAIKQFQKQLELNPKDQYAHSNIGIALLSLKKYSEAVPEFLLGIQAQPENASTHIRLAECYLNTDQREKALTELRSAVGMATNASVWNSAAWTLAKSKAELERAQEYANTALAMDSASLKEISLDPLSGAPFTRVNSYLSTLDTLGWIQFLRGDVENGLKNLTRAWQYSEDPVIADHLAQVYQAKHDEKNAVRYSALAIIAEKSVPFASNDEEDAASASHARLELLASSGHETLLAAAQKEIDAQHTVNIANSAKIGGDAEFAVVVGDHKNSKARFVRGEESLRSAESSIATAMELQGNDYELARWAKLHCEMTSSQCSVTLLTAKKAMLAQRRDQSSTLTLSAVPDPNVFSSESLGMRFVLPESWAKVSETHSPQRGMSSVVVFNEPGTLATLRFERQYLQVNSDAYQTSLEENLKRLVPGYHRLSISTVVRDGLEGCRIIFNLEDKSIEWYGFMEVFSVGDEHYIIVGQSPRDMYSRYANELDNTMRSLSFPKHHVSQNDLPK